MNLRVASNSASVLIEANNFTSSCEDVLMTEVLIFQIKLVLQLDFIAVWLVTYIVNEDS